MAKISLSFKSYNQAAKGAFGSKVYQSMSTSPLFVAYKPQIDELKTILDALQIAAANAKNGGRDRIAEKDKCLDMMISQLVLLSSYVTIEANGNEEVIWAAGFETQGVSSVTPKMSFLLAPTNFKVGNVDGLSGVVRMSWDAVKDTRLYGIQRMIGDDGVWQNGDYSSTPKETILSGFEPGTKVTFKIQALGITGVKSDFSSSVFVWVS